MASTPPSTEMEFGLDIVTDRSIGELRELWSECGPSGLATIGVPDSPAICREMYISAADCLALNPTNRVLTAVSNPITRDVGVTAAALCSLAERFPGRIDFGIGTGDSALWGTGLKSSTVAGLRDYIVALRALLRGETTEYRGRTFRLRWNELPEAAADIDIYVACSGPKVLTMAAEVADGAVLAFGFAPDDVAYIDEMVANGSALAGRDPDAFQRWWHCSMRFSESIEAGMNENIGINPGWLSMSTMEGKRIPLEFQEPLRQLTADFRTLDAEYKSDGRNATLSERAKELGLFEWLTARGSGLWGTPADIAARLEYFRGRGMNRWMFYGGGPDVDRLEWIRTFGRDLMPLLTTARK